MRKIYSLIALAVASSVVLSCAKDIESQNAAADGDVFEFTASFASVKAGLNAGKTEWKSGDKISVNGVEFTAQSSGLTSSFKGTVPAGTEFKAPFKAVYPASAGKDISNVRVPAVQTAVEGSFDPAACVAVAESSSTTLAFRNVTSLVKFTVSAGVGSVTLSSNGNATPLAGDVSANGSDGSFSGTPSEYSVTVKCSAGFKAGVEYFMAVLPGEHSGGFTMSVDNFEVKSVSKSLSITKSTIVNAGKLPEVLKFVPRHWVSEDNPWYAAYFFGDGSLNAWRRLEDKDKDGIYGCGIPEGKFTHVIFCRMNPAFNDLAWDDSEHDRVFNQSQNMPLENRKEYAVMPLFEAYSHCGWSSVPDFAEPGMIYLLPNANWNDIPKEHAGKKPTFAATFWDPSVWSFMTDEDGDGIYQCEKKTASTGIILARMIPGTTTLNWDNKWNQTADLPVSGWNFCVIPENQWDRVQNTYYIK